MTSILIGDFTKSSFAGVLNGHPDEETVVRNGEFRPGF
jgi:hypothetical protein